MNNNNSKSSIYFPLLSRVSKIGCGTIDTSNIIHYDKKLPNIRLYRQITDAEKLIGNDKLDTLFKENNKINRVKNGDPGYIPTSYEYHRK